MSSGPRFNPIALKMAKTLWTFGHSKCNRVTKMGFVTVAASSYLFYHNASLMRFETF